MYLRCLTGKSPKKWSEILPLAQWLYNTNYHPRAHTTPFEVLYKYPPPIHLPWVPRDTRNEVLDRQDRDENLRVLKFHLRRPQDKIEQLADRKKIELSLDIRDEVMVKQHPYK